MSQCNERSKQTAAAIKHKRACARRHSGSSSGSAVLAALTLTYRRLPGSNSPVIVTMGNHTGRKEKGDPLNSAIDKMTKKTRDLRRQ
ncbi:Catenin alpha-2, partial [Dissostichus eleginoides]